MKLICEHSELNSPNSSALIPGVVKWMLPSLANISLARRASNKELTENPSAHSFAVSRMVEKGNALIEYNVLAVEKKPIQDAVT